MSRVWKGPFTESGWAAVLLFVPFVIAAAPGAADGLPTSAPDSTGAVSGEVLDAVTGSPLADCNVTVQGSGPKTMTDARGTFELRCLPLGTINIQATHVGYAPAHAALAAADLRRRIVLRLEPRDVVTPGVTVTATRARDRETPVVFASLRARDIEARRSAEDLPVLLSELPSTTYYSDSGNGVGYTYLSIRGFDQRRISVLINGVPQNDPEDHDVYWVDFSDLASSVQDIQVQRGSGMAFYGPPSIGGSVNVLTESPPVERGGSIEAVTGSEDTRRVTAELSSGLLGGRYAFQGRLSRVRSDGYRDRSWVDFDSGYLTGARYGKRSLLRADFYTGPIDDHLAYEGIAKSLTESRVTRRENPILRPDEVERFNQPHFDLSYELHPIPELTLSSTLFGIWGYGYYDYDGSWAPMSYFRMTSSFGFGLPDSLGDETYADSPLIRAYVDNRQVGWLPQAAWKRGAVELTAGAELRWHRSLHWGRIQKADPDSLVAAAGGGAVDAIGERRYYEYRGAKDIASPYLHALFRPAPRVDVMFDLQYEQIVYRLDHEAFLGTAFSVPYGFWNPRGGVNVNLSRRWNAFASVARTSREPRLKNLYDAAEASTPASWGAVEPQFAVRSDGRFDFSRPLVHPETLDDCEFGAGYESGRVRARANLYWMEFCDEIINQGRVDRFGEPVTGNAPRTRHRGVEFTLSTSLEGGFEAGGNLTLGRNELVEYTVYDGSSAFVLDGNSIAGFPEVLGNARVSYRRGAYSVSAAVQYVGKQYTDNFESNVVDASTVVAASAAVDVGKLAHDRAGLAGLRVTLQVRNLFDSLYNAYGEGEHFFPAAERQVFLGARYAF